MKKNKFIILLAIVAFTMQLFAITVAAATDNSVTYVALPSADMDYSASPASAPKLQIKASNDIEAGAVFQVSLSENAKWTYDDANMSTFFSVSGGNYTSITNQLTNDAAFTYSIAIMTDRDMQITTNEKLPSGSYMHLPIVVKLDGVAEATVSVQGGERYGISGGEYIFANQGWVNSAKLNVSSANVKQNESIITGDIVAEVSACLGGTTFEFTLPGGFKFDTNYKKEFSLKGEGSYSSVKLSDTWINNSQTSLFVKLSDLSLSTSQGKLIFKNVMVNATETAASGDIEMGFKCYDISNEKFDFGSYSKAEETPKEEEPVEKPQLPPQVIMFAATSGSKTLSVNGEQVEVPVAPYNDNNGRMMVPVRFVARAFDASDDNIIWDKDNRLVTLILATRSSKAEIVFKIDSEEYFVNQVPKRMDTVTVIKEGYTFVPARVIADVMGLSVNYDAVTKTAEFAGTFE